MGWAGIGLGLDDMGVCLAAQEGYADYGVSLSQSVLSCTLLRWVALVLFTLTLKGLPLDLSDVRGR